MTTRFDEGVRGRTGLRAALWLVLWWAFAANVRADRLLEGLPSFDVGRVPTAIVAADFTGDGIADLATANRDDDTESVLEGTGFGHFLAQRVADVRNGPTSLASLDFNRDGLSDLVVGHSGSGELALLRNVGGGVFVAPAVLKLGGAPTSIATGDFNGDGATDFVVSRQTFDNVAVYVSDGVSGFLAPHLIEAGERPAQVIAVDVDGDTDLDLVTANSGASNFSVIRNQGAGVFGFPITFQTENGPTGVATIDANLDGLMDLVLISRDERTAAAHLNMGGGTFGEKSVYFAGDDPLTIIAVELDGNKATDIAIANHDGSFGGIRVMLSYANGTFLADRFFGTPGRASGLAAVDVERDGVNDLVLTDESNATVAVSACNGGGWLAAAWTTQALSVVGLDINNDGLGDLAYARVTIEGGIGVDLGDHRGVLSRVTRINPPTTYRVVRSADLNGDGFTDIVGVRFTGGAVESWLNQRDNTFVLHSSELGFGIPDHVVVANVNGDGFPDLITSDSPNFSYYLNDGDGGFVRHLPTVSRSHTDLLAWNLDGLFGDDIVLGSSSSQGLPAYLNNGETSTNFPVLTFLPGGDGVYIDLRPSDFDGDGDLDVVQAAAARITLRRNSPAGFEAGPTLTTGVDNIGDLVVDDLDGDGLDDIVVSQSPSVARFFRNLGGNSATLLTGIPTVAAATGVISARLGEHPGNHIIARNLLFYRNSTPWVARIEVAGPRAVDVHFSEPMAGAVLDRFSYQASGPGSGTLATFPDAVSGLSPYAARLTWVGGEMGGGADVTVAVSRDVTDLRGNAVGFVTSATAVGGGIGGVLPVSDIADAPAGAAATPIMGTFTASDPDGSGIAAVDLFARKEGGVWQLVATLSGNSFSFTPTQGSGRYFLQTVARDGAGNTEEIPAGPTGEGDTKVVFNAVENGALTLDVAADTAEFFPMSGSAVGVEIDFTAATAGGPVTVSRTLNPVASAPPLDTARLIDESVTIAGPFGGTAGLAWTYDPESVGGVVGPVSTLFQREGEIVINQFTVTPTDGTTLRVSGLASFSEWFAGNAGLVAADSSSVTLR